jgi:ribokinase
VAAAVHAAAGTVVLNPAPAASLPASVLAEVDVLVPNRSELAVLAGAAVPSSVADAAELAATLNGPGAVVVTLGEDGAVVVAEGETTHIPAVSVDAVDATGAGDAFCGALADALSRGESLVAAAEWAVRVAGMSTTRWGAQTVPTRSEATAFE